MDEIVEQPKPLGLLEGLVYELLDPRFAACTVPGGRAERLWTGGTWAEGPAWLDAGYLVWSDIPNNIMMRWDEAGNAVSRFRHPSRGANGNTVDRAGRLITCEHDSRQVTRMEANGAITVLATHYRGKRLNSPNDVVEKSDGSVWFTDPSYGGGDLYEGVRELDGCHVYRLDPVTGDLAQMTTDMVMPNGLAFSADESLLYVVDTGSTSFADGPNHIRRFAVGADGTLGGGEVFINQTAKLYDGLRSDSAGRIWCANEQGVHCHHPDGTLIGKLRLPERAANLTFGGRDGGTMLITATTSLYRVPVNTGRS